MRNCNLSGFLAGALLLLVAFLSIDTANALETRDIVGQMVSRDYSSEVKSFVLVTLLSLIPVLLISMTSFTRIVIVLSLLRHAIGLPQTPPNSVIIILSICLTYFSMSPVIEEVNAVAYRPYVESKLGASQAVDRAIVPLRLFMIKQTRESDLDAVLEMSRAEPPKSIDDVAMSHIIPAFMLSELRTAFQIGFVVFLPFLLLDMVVAAVLMALGMIMVPPATISLPLKILLFIIIDGWVLISKALLSSYWT